MPKISAYRELAPFSMGELVENANALLRSKPNCLVDKRIVRFYIANGLLKPPVGPPKLAKYSYHHLLAIIAIRGLQVGKGVSLSRIKDELREVWEGDSELVESIVDKWLESPSNFEPDEKLSQTFEEPILRESRPYDSDNSGSTLRFKESYMRQKNFSPRMPDSRKLEHMEREIRELRRQLEKSQMSMVFEDKAPYPVQEMGAEFLDALKRSDMELHYRVEVPLQEIREELSKLAVAVFKLTEQVQALTPPVDSARHSKKKSF